MGYAGRLEKAHRTSKVSNHCITFRYFVQGVGMSVEVVFAVSYVNSKNRSKHIDDICQDEYFVIGKVEICWMPKIIVYV